MSEAVVEVVRGETVESRHRVSVAVVHQSGRVEAHAGDARLVTFARSAVKPLQVLPLIDDGVVDRYSLSETELAICCASHSGEPIHVEATLGILHKIGLSREALACGPHAPWHAPSARALEARGEVPGRVHNNCSGKHAGMLALARFHGWPTEGYERREHPVQQRMLREVAHWAGVAEGSVPVGVDGCGVATFALPLMALARSFGALVGAARSGVEAPYRVVQAIARHPEYVAGSGRLCTQLVRVTQGRVIAKVGAEGGFCAGIPEAELGVAVKVEDGARRGSEPALLETLRLLGHISDGELAELRGFHSPALVNNQGTAVGFVRPRIELRVKRG